MITYNHEKFIAQAIEGVLNQRTTFMVQLILCNDASTDGTHSVIENYIGNYDHKVIEYFNHSKNLGMVNNFIFGLRSCSEKYIAICEGDDYWTDIYKLQKQVDFLENNEEFAICASNYITIEKKQETKIFRNPSNNIFRGLFSDLVRSNQIPTLTSVFRRSALDESIYRNLENVPYPDWILWSAILNKRHLCFAILPSITAVQNIHQNGVYSSITDKHIILLNELKTKLRMFRIANLKNKRIVLKEINRLYSIHSSDLKGIGNWFQKKAFFILSFRSK